MHYRTFLEVNYNKKVKMIYIKLTHVLNCLLEKTKQKNILAH